ncbi:MAG: BrnT family toxin [Duganella sp.]
MQPKNLDFLCANEVFDGLCATTIDNRIHYGEVRKVTPGYLDNRVVVVVWTDRGHARRIISMRKANERETKNFSRNLG